MRFLVALSIFFPSVSYCCTAFELASPNLVTAYSFDWFDGFGFVLTNPAGVEKSALRYPNLGSPQKWTSKYGSVTFNHMGVDFPQNGMNEKGLSVQSLRTDHDGFRPELSPNQNPYLNERQWIQFLLDNAADLNEAILITNRLKLHRIFTPNHLFVCDRHSDCGVFEVKDGVLTVVRGADLSVSAITNYRYEISSQDLGKPIPNDPKFDARFVRVAGFLNQFASKRDPVAHAFNMLWAVPYPQGSLPARWLVIYEPEKKVIRFLTNDRINQKIIDLKAIDFRPGAQARMIDVQTEISGKIAHKLKPIDLAALDLNTDRTRFLHAPDQPSDLAERVKRYARNRAAGGE